MWSLRPLRECRNIAYFHNSASSLAGYVISLDQDAVRFSLNFLKNEFISIGKKNAMIIQRRSIWIYERSGLLSWHYGAGTYPVGAVTVALVTAPVKLGLVPSMKSFSQQTYFR